MNYFRNNNTQANKNWSFQKNNGQYNGRVNNAPLNPQKKKSGCSVGQDKNSQPYVRGWKADKTNGLRSFYACPYKGTKRVKSENGNEWENWMVKVTPRQGQTFIVSGLYQLSTKKVFIKDLGLVMNHKGGRGGYTGPFYYRNN